MDRGVVRLGRTTQKYCGHSGRASTRAKLFGGEYAA